MAEMNLHGPEEAPQKKPGAPVQRRPAAEQKMPPRAKKARRFALPRCPYCGKKANPFLAWVLRTEGEYHCSKCGGVSNVLLSSSIYLMAAGAVLLSAAVYIINRLAFGGKTTALLIFLMVAPFLLFYFLSIFLIRLKKPVFVKKKVPPAKGARGRTQPAPQPPAPAERAGAAGKSNLDHTIVMDRMK